MAYTHFSGSEVVSSGLLNGISLGFRYPILTLVQFLGCDFTINGLYAWDRNRNLPGIA